MGRIQLATELPRLQIAVQELYRPELCFWSVIAMISRKIQQWLEERENEPQWRRGEY